MILARFAISATSATSLTVGVGEALARPATRPTESARNFMVKKIQVEG